MLRHDEPVLGDLRRSTAEMAESLRNIDDPVAMAHVATSVGLANRDICLWVSVFQHSLVMRRAESPGPGIPVTSLDLAHLLPLPQRAQIDDAVPVETLEVSVTQVFGINGTLTVGGGARSSNPHRPRRAWVSVFPNPSVVHLAMSLGVMIPSTPFDRAFSPHIPKVRGGQDRFSAELGGQDLGIGGGELADEARADVGLGSVVGAAPVEQRHGRGTGDRRGQRHAGSVP